MSNWSAAKLSRSAKTHARISPTGAPFGSAVKRDIGALRRSAETKVVNNPYEVISDFWGESLSPELLDRMVSSPEAHYDAFSEEYLTRQAGLDSLPALPRAHVRPILTASAADEFQRARKEVFREAPLLLLYAHEVVLSSPDFEVTSLDTHERETALRWLLSVKPLFDMGIIHIRPDDSAKRHPAFAHRANAIEKFARELAEDPLSSVAQFRELWRRAGGLTADNGVAQSGESDPILWRLALDASAHNDHERRYGKSAHRLFKSQAELDLWTALEGRRETLQERTQAKLVSVDLPKFEHAIPDLVAIRQSSEAFADWRSALGAAVAYAAPGHEIGAIPPAELRRDLAEQLAPLAERINGETRRSSALSSLRVGAKEFGLGAVASTIGLAVGGSLTTALATGGAANTMKAAAEFRSRRASASREASLGKLAMLFFDE